MERNNVTFAIFTEYRLPVRSQKQTRCIKIFDRTPRNGLKIMLLRSFSPFSSPEPKARYVCVKCESCFQARKPSRELISCFSCKSRVRLNSTGVRSTSCVEAIAFQHCAHPVMWLIQTVTSFLVSRLVMPGTGVVYGQQSSLVMYKNRLPLDWRAEVSSLLQVFRSNVSREM